MTQVLRRDKGVITLRGLRELGFSEREVEGLVRHGDLRRLYRGVYADGRNQLTDRAHLGAALLAMGDGAWLAGRTAAAVWGLDAISLARIEIGVAATSTPTHTGLRVTRSSDQPHRSELKTRQGLRISAVPLMLCEVARTATPAEIDVVVEQAIRKGILDLGAMEATLERQYRRPGVGRLKQALKAYRARPKRRSTFEEAFDRWLHDHPEIPEPQRNVKLGVWELDCYWPDHQLVLELDARQYHVAAQDFERDRRKDAWLQRHGLRILRVTGNRWDTDRPGVYDDLMGMLALGQPAAA